MDEVIDKIDEVYDLAFDTVYILENVDDPTQVILTYNIDSGGVPHGEIPESTISVHRKKQTNTIYTINALNKLIMEKNNGILDISFKVDWTELSNTVLVTAYNRLKRINTKILEVRRLTN